MRHQSRHLPAFILLELLSGARHGGALQSSLNERLPDLNADSGAVYRALNKMEEDGEVSSKWDTTMRGPARHIYKITERGAARLEEGEKDISRRHAILSHFLKEYRRSRTRGRR
jgi:PadR family transcriptional regulator, regulatory protein PadR